MVVMAMVGKSTAVRRAELQQEGAPARGHESDGNIGAKQKRGQPYEGRYIGSPSVPEPSLHDLGALPCQSRRHCSSWHRSLTVRQLEAAHPAWSPTASSVDKWNISRKRDVDGGVKLLVDMKETGNRPL
jgi:hypothetical protein